jgi:hypothetical protein
LKHNEFRIGSTFKSGIRTWRCTDIGSRTIIAIALDHDEDTSWYNGPPYAIVECVFDEYDMPGCQIIDDMI